MTKKVKLFGLKALPIWLLVVALVAGGAGAAVGTILAGNVVAEIPVTISQALEVGKPVLHPEGNDLNNYVENMPQGVDALDLYYPGGAVDDGNVKNEVIFYPDRSIGAVNDTQTAFQFAAEIDQHDWYVFYVPLKNASNQDMTVQLKMQVPNGLTVEVMDTDTAMVDNVTRVGLNTWKFNLDADADKSDEEDAIYIVVAASDTIAPGFYTIEGELLQISY